MLKSRNYKAKSAQIKPIQPQQQPKTASAVVKKPTVSLAPTFPSVQFHSTNRYGGKVVIEAVLLADILD